MSYQLRDILLKLCRREDLTRDEAQAAFAHIMSGEASEAQVGGLLVGLAAKGSTVDELVGAATVMREKVLPVVCDGSDVILDTCGTGGDVKGTFNISTAAALIAAAAGVRVVKHGNRSASGRSGSADVLEKLGLQLELPGEKLSACLAAANICFAFARSHHPAMKFVAAARSSLGIPTLFNLLGPLTNPARARHQLLGVFAPELTDRMAAVLRELGSERAWVVHADDGLDEISTMGPTRISELANGHIQTWKLDPTELGIAYASLSELQVHSIDEAADAIRGVLAGGRGPRRDIAVLNAAAALVVAGRADSLPKGIELASAAIDSGKAAAALAAIIEISQSVSADYNLRTMTKTEIKVVPDAKALTEEAARRIVAAAESKLADNQHIFSLVLSGGSTPKTLYELLASDAYRTQLNWSKVEIYFGDERCVPPDHSDSNYLMAYNAMLSKLPIPQPNIHRIRGEITPEAAAIELGQLLKDKFKDGGPDLVLLGMGDDGHTASLFPNTTALEETHHRSVANRVEKLNTWRVTMTYPFLNKAKEVIMLISGAGKASRLKEVLEGPRDPKRLPIQGIAPINGSVTWLVDAPAAAMISHR